MKNCTRCHAALDTQRRKYCQNCAGLAASERRAAYLRGLRRKLRASPWRPCPICGVSHNRNKNYATCGHATCQKTWANKFSADWKKRNPELSRKTTARYRAAHRATIRESVKQHNAKRYAPRKCRFCEQPAKRKSATCTAPACREKLKEQQRIALQKWHQNKRKERELRQIQELTGI